MSECKKDRASGHFDATYRLCVGCVAERDAQLSAVTERADAMERALREIDKVVYSHRKGSAAECQRIARKALLPREGRGEKGDCACGHPQAGHIGHRSGECCEPGCACVRYDAGATPAPEGFEEWHRRECARPGLCIPSGGCRWLTVTEPRWRGRTCREVYDSERPARGHERGSV